MAEETNVQAYMEGLSRVDRVVDDSGFAFTALDVIDKGLASLEPIKSYPHLLYVNVSKNQIADATPLSELQFLVSLDLSDNAIAAPLALPHQHLRLLDVSQNQIATLQGFESSSLASLKINGKHMTHVSTCNSIENLVGLGGMSSLSMLEASRNSIADLSSLASDVSTKLETLHLDENKLSTLSGIESLQALRSLSLRQNNIETLEAVEQLAQLGKLATLDLTGNPVTEVEDYRLSIILLAPTLAHLDGEPLTDEDRLAAVELKQRREAQAAEEEEADS